jgi:hypothetical protein
MFVLHTTDIGGGAQPALTLADVLETIVEFGSASTGLIAWEYYVAESDVIPLFADAIREGLLETSGRDPESGEQMYTATLAGRDLPERQAA